MSSANDHPLYTEVKTALLLHVPFFASLLLDMMKVKIGKFDNVFPPGVPHTAATNGKTIWFDKDFFESLSLPQRVFVICHEIGHAMWSHLSRARKYQDTGFEGQKFNPFLWNVAGDYVINAMLVNCRIGKMPDMALHDPKYGASCLVDDVYRELMQNPPPGGAGGGNGNGDGDGPAGHGSFDVHINEIDETSEVEWKRAVQTAANAAKAQGQLPAGLERFVDELLNPKVPWVEKLRSTFMKIAGRIATTWTKPHRRRLITQKVILPSYTGFGAGVIVFVCDTSGSMSTPEMAQGLGECDNIVVDCNPKEVILLGCDARINSEFRLYPGDSLRENPPPLGGGGGTSFKPPFKWLEDEGIRPDCLVYFTDMYGDFPDEDPGYPVIWCSTSENMEAPFGETIYVELGEQQ